jgi:hypothetical protein
MKRKLPTETAADFSHMDDTTFATLRRKLARWADDNWEARLSQWHSRQGLQAGAVPGGMGAVPS